MLNLITESTILTLVTTSFMDFKRINCLGVEKPFIIRERFEYIKTHLDSYLIY